MKLTVLGASGKTGSAIVTQALEAGHSVNALVRRSNALESRSNLNVIVADVTDPQDIAKASQGTDVIISALGAMGGSLMTDAVNAVITSSKTTGVKRFILLSSFAVRKEQMTSGMKLIYGLVMGKAIKDKSASEALLRNSDLDWTIVYATSLTNDAKGATVRVLGSTETFSMKHKIARADLAAWMLDEAQKNAYVKAEITISQ
jgi:putative NADH-flavin reductase